MIKHMDNLFLYKVILQSHWLNYKYSKKKSFLRKPVLK